MTLKIKTKIIVSFIIVTVLLSFLGTLAYHNRNLIFESMIRVENETHHLEVVSDLKLAMDMVVMPPNDYLITGDPKEKKRFEEAISEVERNFALTKELAMHERRSAILYTSAVEKFMLLKERAVEIFDFDSPVGNPLGAGLMLEMDTIANDIIANHLDRLYLIEKEEIDYEIATAEKVRKSVNMGLLAGIIISTTTVTLLAVYLLRSIIRPIESFTQGASIIRNGDLTHRISINDGVEINVLADEFNKMAEKLWESHAELEKKVGDRTRELNEMNEKLKELSITDGLTAVYNQRFFYEKLADELKRASRYDHNVSLIMCDIDYFKMYNDANGHLEGDIVLKEVAEILQKSVRLQDTVARYGGEEFCIIMPETDKKSALGVAERIRIAVHEHPFKHESSQPKGNLTISLGIATCPDDAEGSTSLIKMADDALYRAKNGGRNRIES